MIGKFADKSKVLLVPAQWLNAVAAALNGAYSPQQTVEVTIEGEGEGSRLSLEIRPQAAASAMVPHLAAHFPRKNDPSLLGEGLKWDARGLSIDKEWLKRTLPSL